MTGLEPATPGLTSQCSDRLSYITLMSAPYRIRTGDFLTENQASWAGLDQRGMRWTAALQED